MPDPARSATNHNMQDRVSIDPTLYTVDRRSGLPDALRILLQEYPRDDWAQAPGFDGLIRFWLQRHLMFRRILDALQETTQEGLNRAIDGRRLAATISRHGGLLVQELHTHHVIEDTHYFPVLQKRDARIAVGFDILDADHHALDARLNAFTEAANDSITALLDGADSVDPAARFQGALQGLHGLIDRHLEDEEDLVVPVLLRYGTEGFG